MFTIKKDLFSIQFGFPETAIRTYLIIITIIYPYLFGISVSLAIKKSIYITTETSLIIDVIVLLQLILTSIARNFKISFSSPSSSLLSILSLFSSGFFHYTRVIFDIPTLMLINDILILIAIITTGTIIISMTSSKYIIAELYTFFFSIVIVPLSLSNFQLFFNYHTMMNISSVLNCGMIIHMILLHIRK
jgi:hypothetical protein